MELDFKEVEIKEDNIDLLKVFIENLNEEKKTFRYYNNRSLRIISNHLYTSLLFLNDEPVSYGHLDKENDIVWLGILVKEQFQGKGIAKRMMSLLVARAKELNLTAIQLSVDKINNKAISLYLKYEFKVIQEYENNIILERII